ncbi:MAG: flavin reductase [Caldilineaceae bacterium]
MKKPSIDPKAFRNALGRFASGVTVVTTVVDDKVHGMTASAFVSVSLDPPLVLVSVDKRPPARHVAGRQPLRGEHPKRRSSGL